MNSKIFWGCCAASAACIVVAACSSPAPAASAAKTVAATPDFRLTGTIKDIMDGVVDPSADYLWDSVSTIVTRKGVEERRPRTDEDWKNVRRRAIELIEAPNLLIMDGRKVAKPGEKSENPGIELG